MHSTGQRTVWFSCEDLPAECTTEHYNDSVIRTQDRNHRCGTFHRNFDVPDQWIDNELVFSEKSRPEHDKVLENYNWHHKSGSASHRGCMFHQGNDLA